MEEEKAFLRASLSFMFLLSFFAFWELAKECTSTEESFSPQWFLSLSCAVGCLCGLIINIVQKAIVGHDEVIRRRRHSSFELKE